MAGRRSSPLMVRPVALRWMWLSTNAGRHEAAVEVDHFGVGELVAADVVAAQPRHDVAAHRHGGGVGMGRTVHPCR